MRTWPELAPITARIAEGGRDAVKAELTKLVAAGTTDGRINLLAQLERQDGNLDRADTLIERALASNPKQHLHHFQQAMIGHARLSKATGPLERWRWHRRTRGSYEAAFALDPEPIPYRYYLISSYLQAPPMAGGDKDKALQLTEEAIRMGQKEFLVLRGDIHRLRGETAAAFADYDRAMADRTFKLRSFIAASDLALEQRDVARAKRYLDWAAQCRPDSPELVEARARYAKAAVR